MTSTKYSISAASRITGKSRATIARHLKASKLSFELDNEGNKQIDASELMRVYGDACDFLLEERRGKGSDTQRSETSPSPNDAALDAVREQLIDQYKAQVEHLQQALEKAQDGQNRVTLLLEQKSSEPNDWQTSLDAMGKSIANQTEAQIKELRDGHDREIKQLKRALHQERSKSLWQKLIGR
ncbi:hypothetical protein [Botrimarina hoheduenensis]|uniref:Uncharacterized protein n=1 Tax=Botrimarina hoheduenensis TaxID=2528000 RepID=A0A5C5VZU6_9BACT|nr:hypothetical protein [Botrimarina hoheduenensis]TWT43463.1 hypothetical protein Pla111_24140 [Botrimarina hoheduenensis]